MVEVDWALSVLLVQTQKKIPVIARDPTQRILSRLVHLLELSQNSAPIVDPMLIGFLFNSQAVPGSLRRERVAIILLNAVQVEDNMRVMLCNRPLITVLLQSLDCVSEIHDSDLETRVILYQLLEAVCDSFLLKDAQPFLRVVTGALACSDSRRSLALAIFSKVARNAQNMSLLLPALDFPFVDTMVRMLGDALLRQSEFPGGPDGATQLEQCLEFVVSCSGDARICDSFFPQTHLVRLLVMFLLEALDPSAPRSYLSLFRKALTFLSTLTTYQSTRAQLVLYFNDVLKISCSKSVLAPEVVPLLQLISSISTKNN